MSYERLKIADHVDKWDIAKVKHIEDGIVSNEGAIQDMSNNFIKGEIVQTFGWEEIGTNIYNDSENVVLSKSIDINNLNIRVETGAGEEDIITNNSKGLTISKKSDNSYILSYISGVNPNTAVYELRIKGMIDGSGETIVQYVDMVSPEAILTIYLWSDESSKLVIPESAIPDSIARVEDISNIGKSIEPAHMDIPRIFFNNTLQTTKEYKVVKFYYCSQTQRYEGYAKIKMQGNYSTLFPKKNQTIKFYADKECAIPLNLEFKNWGKHNKYVLKANWTDITHSRNIVSARIWGDIVKSRENNIIQGPNYGAVDGFPVKVYAKGVYQGRYTLNIPKEDWMVGLDSSNPDATFIYSDGYVNGGCFTVNSLADWKDKIHGGDSEVLSGDLGKKWSSVLDFVINSKNAEFKYGLKDYLDVDSVLDYYLFNLLNCGLDSFGKNQLFITYGKDDVWHASAYDMDATWGQYYEGTMINHNYDRGEYEDYKNVNGGNKLYSRLEELCSTELLARWKVLKEGPLSVENILNRFEEFIEIAPKDLVEEDYASTTANGAFTNIPSKTENNLQQIRQCVLDRHNYVETYLWNLY